MQTAQLLGFDTTVVGCTNDYEKTALLVKDGFTPEQRFFLSYAGVWAGNIRAAQIRCLLYTSRCV